MSAQVIVVLGPARAGKTHELLGRYRDALTRAPSAGFARVLWLAPSSRAAAAVRDQIIAGGIEACLEPGVTTFDHLSQQIISASNLKTRIISAALERELLRRTVAAALDAGSLKFYAEAATHAGFIDMLGEHIRELKRRDIRPPAYQRIAASRGQPAHHQELARLYADYERQLQSHGLYDEEGQYWVARDALANGACPRFTNLELICVDGFTDFTRTQHEILRLLADRAGQLFISLPADADVRADVFAKTTATLAELKRSFPQLEVRHVTCRPTTCAALDHVTQHVFRHPQPTPPTEALASLERIEIIQAASAHDEIVQLARRIKAQLKKGSGLFFPYSSAAAPIVQKIDLTPFSDIVVVFRSVADVAPRIDEVFERYGIPYSLESSPRIASAPLYKTLVALLRLDQEDWPFRRVVSVITNNSLTAIGDAARQAAEWLVRDLQLAQGRHKLLEMIGVFAEQPNDAQDISEHRERRIAAAVAARPAFVQLAAALDRLPREASANQWAAALAQLGAELGLNPFALRRTDNPVPPPQQPAMKDGQDCPSDESNRRAWEALVEHFAAWEQLDAWLGTPRKLDRQELLSLLIDIATHEGLPRAHDDIGRVRVLSAQSARAVSARHLYLAGMSEQAFPAAARPNQLVTEAEYRFFTSAAHQESAHDDPHDALPATRAQEEMLLFYEVLSRAEESLTISYPAMDDKAQDLPPSPYVVELQRMFRGEKQIHCTKPQLSPLPPVSASLAYASGPHCIADWRISAMAEALQPDGDLRPLAGLFSCDQTKPLARALDAGVRIVHARARGEKFGPSEGLLMSPAVVARLGQRFGPQHSWSPSQFETYAACPYKFYLENVLQLEPLGELVLETDFARRGSLLHQVLASFHGKYGDSPGDWTALWRDEPRFTAELQRELQAAFDAIPREGIERALLELDRRQIAKWSALYRGQHEKYDGAWSQLDEPPRPSHFELRFGRKHAGEAGGEDPRSTDAAFSLDIGGESINVSGRIDRIDVGRHSDKTIFNVIDYKSGRRPTLTRDKIESGERLQPALYVMAAQALVFDKDGAPLWAGYWSMQGGVTTDKRFSLHCSVEGNDAGGGWKLLRDNVVARIRQIVRAARRGDFPIDSRDPHCTSVCEFKTVCRVAQVRSVGKVHPPGDA